MNKRLFCQSLIGFRNNGISLGAYLGFRWIILKVLMAVIAFAILLCAESRFHFVALLLLGYLVGVVTAGVRSYLVAKHRWDLQREVIDWAKVEQCAETKNS